MTFEQLKEKAHSLPLKPGVYIMRDKNDGILYVGKAINCATVSALIFVPI